MQIITCDEFTNMLSYIATNYSENAYRTIWLLIVDNSLLSLKKEDRIIVSWNEDEDSYEIVDKEEKIKFLYGIKEVLFESEIFDYTEMYDDLIECIEQNKTTNKILKTYKSWDIWR